MEKRQVFWRYLPLVLKLIEMGAWRDWVYTTTVDLASKTRLPQQTVSRALKTLENAAFIERRKTGRGVRVRLTEKCLGALRPVYERLLPVFEEFKTLRFSGIVTSGFGDGVHYVQVYMERFEEKLGFRPYPGTLNLRIVDREDLKTVFTIRGLPALRIDAFKRGGRIYGAVSCYRALIGDVIEGAIVVPERTHYGPDIVELIAPESIREKLSLKDGDKVSVEVRVDV